ncbi:DUF4920 domain-containing protein [Pontibacter saemangeumensis]
MKKTLLALFLAFVAFGCSQKAPVTVLSSEADATIATSSGTSYGAAVSDTDAMPANQLVSALAGKDSIQATVAAEIAESCQSKGCWMDVKLSDHSTMKVTFRDYSFFIPVEDLKGRQVVFTGTALHQQVSVEDQRHYAADAGKSAAEIASITVPKNEIRFIADGVILK